MKTNTRLSFLGAAGTVTGSRYLLEVGAQRVLVDCGLFQGYKNLRRRNWQPFPVSPASIDAVFLTHAHLDHSGYLPRLAAEGFDGPVYCSAATRDLCKVLLLDSAKIQTEEAAYRNRHQYSRHPSAEPLYTVEDVDRVMKQFKVVKTSSQHSGLFPVSMGNFEAVFYPNGHILGSCFLDVSVSGRHILFSGDMGRPTDLLMRPPELPVYCDYLVVESTYGNRLHDNRDVWDVVSRVVSETAKRGGKLLIPSFAVGRAQVMLYLLTELRRRQRIPQLPIYLDSPMAIRATKIMQKHCGLHRLSKSACDHLSREVEFVETVEESIAINQVRVPCIVLSASGMATGGRVLHHLQRMVEDHRNTILFAGYQAGGTRGGRLVAGARQIKIFNKYFDVRAQIENLDFLSAHADRIELIRWLQQMPVAPKHCFVTHGEPEAADQFRISLQEELQWSATVPEIGDSVEL